VVKVTLRMQVMMIMEEMRISMMMNVMIWMTVRIWTLIKWLRNPHQLHQTVRGGGGEQPGGRTVQDNVENKACSQDSDEEQGLRWLNFMAQQSESGDKLLKAMELIDDDQELCHLVAAEQELEEDNLQSAEQIARCYEQFQVFLTEEGKEMSAKTAVSPDLEGLKMLRLWDAEDQGIEQSRTVT
jgi:hypothetical protein